MMLLSTKNIIIVLQNHNTLHMQIQTFDLATRNKHVNYVLEM